MKQRLITTSFTLDDSNDNRTVQFAVEYPEDIKAGALLSYVEGLVLDKYASASDITITNILEV